MKVYGFTDTGLKRSNNQDTFLVSDEHGVYVVADGMGGHLGGEIASQMAAEKILEYLSNQEMQDATPTGDEPPAEERIQRELTLAVQAANRDIVDRSMTDKECKGMGTTVVAMKVEDGKLFHAHVGDSRLYRIDAAGIWRLTKDHSRVQELIDTGTITEEEAERSPFRNIITRALGGAPDVEVDTAMVDLDEDACYLACSDGLHGCMHDERLRSIVIENADEPEEFISVLHQEVEEAGAPDNVTMVFLVGRDFAKSVQNATGSSQDLSKLADTDRVRAKEMATETQTLSTAKLSQDRNLRDFLGIGPDSYAEELERQEQFQRSIVGLVAFAAVLVFMFFSYFNYSHYYVEFNPVKEEFEVYQGKFLPVGMNLIDTHSVEEPSLNLMEYVNSIRLRSAVNTPKAFASREEANIFIAEFVHEIAKNLGSKRVERDLRYAIQFFQMVEEFNPDIETDSQEGMAFYDLGIIARDGRRFTEAIRFFDKAIELNAQASGLPVANSLADTREMFLEDAENRIMGFVARSNYTAAEKVITEVRGMGFPDDSIAELQTLIDENRSEKKGLPIPPPRREE